MPSLPAIALFAGLGIDRLTRWVTGLDKPKNNKTRDKRKLGTFIITLIILGALILWCVLPAVNYFDNLGPGGVEGRPRKPPVGPIIVNTDRLINDPYRFQDEFVLVENAEVIDIDNSTFIIRSLDARLVEGVPVSLNSWPRDEIPDVYLRDRVEVVGLFVIRPVPDQTEEFYINIKYDTKDYIRVLK